MSPLSPITIRELCARAKMRPQRSAGQHYLIDARVLERIVGAVDPQPADTILEIGAGFGVLTTALAEKRGQTLYAKGSDPFSPIIALEREHRVIPILCDLVMPYGNVEVVEGDILDALRRTERVGGAEGGSTAARRAISSTVGIRSDRTRERLLREMPNHWKLAANLPYGITSEFLRLLFDRIADGSLSPPERIVLLLQREVVDRMLGVSGGSVLAILTEIHGTAQRITNVPPSAFWPPPKVESAVIRIDHLRTPAEIAAALGPITRDQFFAFVRSGFAHPRRQLLTNLSAKYPRNAIIAALAIAGIAPDARPSTLTLAQWIALATSLLGSHAPHIV